MTTQVLTPTQVVPDGAGLNITALLATPTGTTIQFTNSGKEMLFVSAGAVSETVTADIGALIEGQTVSNFPTVSLTNGDLYIFGPDHSVDDQAGTQTMQVTLSTIVAIQVALIQFAGVS